MHCFALEISNKKNFLPHSGLNGIFFTLRDPNPLPFQDLAYHIPEVLSGICILHYFTLNTLKFPSTEINVFVKLVKQHTRDHFCARILTKSPGYSD